MRNGDQNVNKSTDSLFVETSIHSGISGKIFPTKLVLCITLSVTNYTQNYLGIIGLGLAIVVCVE